MKKFYWTHVPLVPLLLLTSKCRLVLGTASTISVDTLRVAKGSPALGRGYSMTTNSFFSSCFDVNATTTEQSYNYIFDFIDFVNPDEWQSKFESIQISESFAYDEIKNIVDEEAQPGEMEEAQKYTAVTTLRIERFATSLLETGDDLKSEYKHLLNHEAYIGYFTACGPNYVRSLKSAQEVTAIITFEADNDEMAQSFADYLKLHILGEGSISNSMIPSSSPSNSLLSSAMPSLSPSASPSSQPSGQVDLDDREMKYSLSIEILGYGLGENRDDSETLVAATLDELNEVMKYAFDSMTKPNSDEMTPRPGGIVYEMEVAPWTDNAEFLNHAGVNSIEIFYPITPRGKIENAKSGPKPCAKLSSRPDDFGKCCSPHEMISVATVNDIGSTVQLSRCEPKMSISGDIMKDNLQTNSEFISWMASVHQEKVQSLSKLGKCIQDLRALPENMEYKFLHANDNARYDQSIDMQYTVKELKAALDPLNSLHIVEMVSREHDEYIEMFYQPCLASLYEMQYGEKKLNHPTFIMAKPWYNVEQCMHLSCLEKNMAWDRKNGEGCVPGILGRQSANEPVPYENDAYCAKQINATSGDESCKYDYSPSYANVVLGMDICRNMLPKGTDSRGETIELSISMLMEYYCLPNIATDVETADSWKMEEADSAWDQCIVPVDLLQPSLQPSIQPTDHPTTEPSVPPTMIPSSVPSLDPSSVPSLSSIPSLVPSGAPSLSGVPSLMPSSAPSEVPTLDPSTVPSLSSIPSLVPSVEPSISVEPSLMPSSTPTEEPSLLPSLAPSSKPSLMPSLAPSSKPSLLPSLAPSSKPTLMPSIEPSAKPSSAPIISPSTVPSLAPSAKPSSDPSVAPSSRPSEDHCSPEANGELKDRFRIVLTPGDDPSDISFTVYARRLNDPFTIIAAFQKDDYTTSDADQESARCLWQQLCMYAVVSSASGNGIGTGSFRAYWRGVPLQFLDEEFSTGYSTKSEQFGRCHDLPAVPSQAPSLSANSQPPSIRPSADPCPESTAGVNQDPFKIVITPGSDPSDLSWRVFRRENGQWTNRDVFRKYGYDNSDPDQESQKCIWNRICMKVVVYSASGNGMQGGSFAAYWNGVPLHFADATFTSGSSTESETFGRC